MNLTAIDVTGGLATVTAAFIGGGLGTLFAAKITAKSSEDAATIAANTATTIATTARSASERAWVNERTREIVDLAIVESDRHYRQVGAQHRRRQEAARGEAEEQTIPTVDPTDSLREYVWRLSLVADENVVETAFRLYRANLRIDRWEYSAEKHFDGRSVIGLTPHESMSWNADMVLLLAARDRLRNAFRRQIGQPELVDPPTFVGAD